MSFPASLLPVATCMLDAEPEEELAVKPVTTVAEDKQVEDYALVSIAAAAGERELGAGVGVDVDIAATKDDNVQVHEESAPPPAVGLVSCSFCAALAATTATPAVSSTTRAARTAAADGLRDAMLSIRIDCQRRYRQWGGGRQRSGAPDRDGS